MDKKTKGEHIDWWKNITPEEKQIHKDKYIAIKKWSDTKTKGLPNMYDIAKIPIDKLENRHILRLWNLSDVNIQRLK